MKIPVALHPVYGPGLHEALGGIDGVELVAPETEVGLVEALAGGIPVLVTFLWNANFLGDGVRWVHAISAGVDQFPLDEFRARGITLTSSRGAHAPAVAEHAIGLLFALTRGIGTAVKGAALHRWAPGSAEEIGMMTVGILGLGSIGGAIADRLHGLGARVIGMKRDPETYDGVAELVVGPEGIVDVFEQSDAVICALPSSPDTEGLIGRREFAALGPGWFVNVGRGSSVDEEALVDALSTGMIAGAALDVTAVEPPSDFSPLWGLDNLIVTPHMAWSTRHLNPRLAAVFGQNLSAFRGEGPWSTRVV